MHLHFMREISAMPHEHSGNTLSHTRTLEHIGMLANDELSRTGLVGNESKRRHRAVPSRQV